jgi:hypothetical protein
VTTINSFTVTRQFQLIFGYLEGQDFRGNRPLDHGDGALGAVREYNSGQHDEMEMKYYISIK